MAARLAQNYRLDKILGHEELENINTDHGHNTLGRCTGTCFCRRTVLLLGIICEYK